jgi:hypothetical protein
LSTSGCGDALQASTTAALHCSQPSAGNEYFIPPPPAVPFVSPPNAYSTTRDIAKYFLNNNAAPKKAKVQKEPFWDPVTKAIIYGSGSLFGLLLLVFIIVNFWKVYTEM